VAELLTEKVVIGWFEGRIEHGPRALGHHRIPGAVHVDGTSRIQTLTDEGTPRLTALLRKFTELTGVPCLINTSFNVAGEPIVRTPTDALNCFLGTEIDYLILGNHLITKTDPVT
jgi:carbamoyltransferase